MPRRTQADPVARAFGAAVRSAREARGETLEDVAARVPRLDPRYLGEIELGWHAPTRRVSNPSRMPATEHVPCQQRVLGIDLGGAASATTGFAMLSGTAHPTLEGAGLQPKSKSPVDSEEALVAVVDECEPTLLALDAPLTLPPCLTCPSYGRGPGMDCELASAREMWSQGRNPSRSTPL